jgi:hypothetical protein
MPHDILVIMVRKMKMILLIVCCALSYLCCNVDMSIHVH